MGSDADEKNPEVADSGPTNFVRDIVAADIASGARGGRVMTRFPPEPNGYLHIGHAKAICLNFGLAEEFNGVCNLRFDDTNPATEDAEYVAAIQRDIEWLGYSWANRLHFTSDYFGQLYDWAVELVKQGKAYVDSLSADEIKHYRGDFYNKGENSPYRDRSAEENLALLEGMKNGDFDEGAHVVRAKIDMASPNIYLRDPPMYRVRKQPHHRTGDAWNIYPMYDYAHGLSDAIEGVTHSVCTLEFQEHRPLYDWFLQALNVPDPPQQIEFAKLAFTYVVLSKRRLLQLVREGRVDGWDDPRMPTLSGMRRLGYTPRAIRNLCERVGVAKRDSVVDIAMLEHAVREDLNEITPRVMAVLRPLKIVIENFPEDEVMEFDAPLHPTDDSFGTRKVQLTRELYIERDDFREDPPRKFFRLAPGREIRLRYACLITCTDVIKNDAGDVVELRCTWDPESAGGRSPDGRKVKGTSHWVSVADSVPVEVRLYDRLFKVEYPLADEDGDWKKHLNEDSKQVLTDCRIEPYLATIAQPGTRVQFERLGYFCVDTSDSKPGALVFNRTITLRDTWAKIASKAKPKRKRRRKQ